MKWLSTFSQFEALSPSQFIPYMKIWQDNPNLRERYKDMFLEYKKKYSGDRNAYRIFLPLLENKKKSDIESEIEKVLNEFDYSLVDYMEGKVRWKDSRNTKRIGQALSQIERNVGEDRKPEIRSLLKSFVEDPIRKQGKSSEYLVCISRHPYDIAGADTNRGWENCMTLGTGKFHSYLLHDVEEGSLVGYLIKKDDLNIKSPIANCAIKPYINEKDPTDVILVRDSKTYPQQYPDFENTVSSWLDEINGETTGIYSLNPKLYNDILGNKVVNVKELTPELVKRILQIFGIKIKDVKINPDMTVDVNTSVDLSGRVLRKIPIKFGKVNGDFWINNCGLKSLEGSPNEITGDFIAYINDLKSLEGGPTKVGGEYSVSSNRLTSLKGAPQEVGSHFDISYNRPLPESEISSLKTKVGGKFVNRKD